MFRGAWGVIWVVFSQVARCADVLLLQLSSRVLRRLRLPHPSDCEALLEARSGRQNGPLCRLYSRALQKEDNSLTKRTESFRKRYRTLRSDNVTSQH